MNKGQAKIIIDYNNGQVHVFHGDTNDLLCCYEESQDIDTFKLNSDKFNDGTNLKDAESDAFKRACMRFGLGVELWSGSTQTEEEHAAQVAREASVQVTKKDMRLKENKVPDPEPRAMEDLLLNDDGTIAEAPF